MFWVWVAVQAAVTITSALLARRAARIPDPQLSVPDTQAGDPIPVAFGTVKLPVRIVEFSAGMWNKSVRYEGAATLFGLGSNSPSGFAYRATFSGLLCHGPVYALVDLLFDNRSLQAAGPQRRSVVNMTTRPPTITYVIENTAVLADVTDFNSGAMQFDGAIDVSVYAPRLLGGPDANGGVSGTVVFRNGHGHNTVPPAIASRYPSGQAPAWRPYAMLTFDDVYLGNSPTLPPLHAVVQVMPRGIAGLISGPRAGDAAGDANPAGILWTLLTDDEIGLGYPEAMLDAGAFSALAVSLGDESAAVSMGLSFVIDQVQPASQIIDEVLRTIDAVLVPHPTTGQLMPWLLRGGSDARFGYSNAVSIPALTTANVRSVEWTAPQPASDVNSVSVKYVDRGRNFTTNTVAVTRHDLVAGAGRVISQTVEFLGLSNESVALRCAQRELRALTTPLGRATVVCDRAPAGVVPGQWVTLTWPEHGLTSRVMRVLEVDWGTLDDPAITLDLVDDVYGMPAFDTTTVVSEPWEPSSPLVPVVVPSLVVQLEQTATTGTLDFAVDDPQERVVSLEWRFYGTRGVIPVFDIVPGTGSRRSITFGLNDTDSTLVDIRVSYTGAGGIGDQFVQTYHFERSAQLSSPVLSLEWTDATTCVVKATPGDGATLTGIRFAVAALPPDDAELAAGTLDTASPYSVTVTVPSGELRYVAARAEGIVYGDALTSRTVRRDLTRGATTAGSLGTRWEPIVAGEPDATVEIVWDDNGDILIEEVPT